jgi:SAM-dependent methyltransferase
VIRKYPTSKGAFMTKDEVLQTYDESYAQRYNQSFLTTPEHRFLEKTQYEIEKLKEITATAKNWLDVACGTGYFLQHARGNTDLECMGLDLSPAMLAEARRANPDVDFIESDYLQPQPSFVDRWEVTSCMWGAYGLQEKISEVETLVANLAKWTKPDGACLMPIFNLPLFAERRDRGELLKGVEVDLKFSCWSFVEPDGKTHRKMLAPQVSVMTAMFERHFGAIEFYTYTGGRDEGLPMVGIIARKRSWRHQSQG